MSVAENKALIQRYFEIGNKGWSTAIREYVADEELVHHIHFFEAAFPGYQLAAEDMVAEGDKVVVRGTLSGTHQGDLMGIPPTGKQVAVPFMIIYRLADGKIVEHWLNADQMSLMQQLGVLPSSEEPA